jgi:hypothetical protein
MGFRFRKVVKVPSAAIPWETRSGTGNGCMDRVDGRHLHSFELSRPEKV